MERDQLEGVYATQPSLIRKIGALQVYLRRAAARAGNLHEQGVEAAFVELKAGLPAALRIKRGAVAAQYTSTKDNC
jgi:hypothetical protein